VRNPSSARRCSGQAGDRTVIQRRSGNPGHS
jgi:hypothetical protein